MEKLLFALDVEDDWPPFASEAVWCEATANGYRLLSIPLFVRGMTVDDVFTATPDPVNGQVFEFEVVAESGRSLVWALGGPKAAMASFDAACRALGCRLETMDQYALHAIDVAPSVDGRALDAAIDAARDAGIGFAFPVWRHG